MCKILKFAYYWNYCADYNQILHSHKDHQILFMGGPNTRKTKSKMADGRHLENRKLAISLEQFDRSSQNSARWRKLGLRTRLVVKIHNFWKSKMADDRHLEKSKIGHISGTVPPIFAKFGRMAHVVPTNWIGTFPTFKNPTWPTAVILKNVKSAIEWYLLMRRHVRVKSAVPRVGKSRIICYVTYFTYVT